SAALSGAARGVLSRARSGRHDGAADRGDPPAPRVARARPVQDRAGLQRDDPGRPRRSLRLPEVATSLDYDVVSGRAVGVTNRRRRWYRRGVAFAQHEDPVLDRLVDRLRIEDGEQVPIETQDFAEQTLFPGH